MIIVIDGNRGQGKTLTAVKEAYLFGLQGYTIYSNLELTFPNPNINVKPYKMSDMISYADTKSELVNSVVLMDEAHIVMDSRTSMTKRNITISYFLLQSRKRNVHIIMTTQFLHQVDKRIRSTADMFISCRYKKNKDLVLNRIFYNNIVSYRSFKASGVFGYYDTNKIIDIND
jgi:DNA helicase HerA-like ATPase